MRGDVFRGVYLLDPVKVEELDELFLSRIGGLDVGYELVDLFI